MSLAHAHHDNTETVYSPSSTRRHLTERSALAISAWIVSKERRAFYRSFESACLDGVTLATLMEVKGKIGDTFSYLCEGLTGERRLIQTMRAAAQWKMRTLGTVTVVALAT